MYSEEQFKNLNTEKEIERIFSIKTEEDLDKWIEDMGLADCVLPADCSKNGGGKDAVHDYRKM